MHIRDKSIKFKMANWSNVLGGLPVFILGNGPSIKRNSLHLLEDYFTIGINRIYEIYTPTILFWQDIEFLRNNYKAIGHIDSVRVCRDIADPKKSYNNYTLALNPYKIHYKPNSLYGRGCSGVLASELAISMGAGSIVLLGCDCKYVNKKQTDFYGKNRHHKKHTLDNFVKCMNWLKVKSPVPIYSTPGNIDLWKQQSLEEIIEILKPPKKTKVEYMSLLSK